MSAQSTGAGSDGSLGASAPARAPEGRSERGAVASTPTAGHARPLRVVLAKPGLDGHDVGAKVVVRALMDAGFEVIYTGLRQTPEAIARIALEEDPDVIALSSMAGSHLPFCTRLAPLLHEAGLADKLWVIGGNLPAQDHAALRELGFRGVFPTGSRLDDVVTYLRENAR